MDNTLSNTIREQLLRHEGIRLRPYRCTAGKLTIGVGRNLDDCGISREEAMIMLDNDINRCESDIMKNIPTLYNMLSSNRKSVLLNMCFNMGIAGLLKFKNTLAYMASGEFNKAADGMLNSKWARQVGNRAIELSKIMRNG